MARNATESHKLGKVDLESHYKGMVAEQNAQIYKQYERISDLIDENNKLKADIVELSAKLDKVQ